MKETPEILNAIVDKILAYQPKPKPKSKVAKKQTRKKTALEKKAKPST